MYWEENVMVGVRVWFRYEGKGKTELQAYGEARVTSMVTVRCQVSGQARVTVRSFVRCMGRIGL